MSDNFSGATRHVSDYLILWKACDRSNNIQISGIDTRGGGRGDDCGIGRGGGRGGGGRGRGGRSGGRSLSTQSDVDAWTNITNKYYPDADYSNFTSSEKQQVWKNQSTSKK